MDTGHARRAALLPLHLLRTAGAGCVGWEEGTQHASPAGWVVEGWVLPTVVVEHIESRRFGIQHTTCRGGGGVCPGGGGGAIEPPSTREPDSSGAQDSKGGGVSRSGGGGKEGLWSRTYDNHALYLKKMQMIAMGLYPLRSPNRFQASIKAL